MIYTARQLEEIHRTVGQIVLPYRARLSPLAKDWLRAKKITVGYSEVLSETAVVSSTSQSSESTSVVPTHGGLPILSWFDGPTGVGKAAVSVAAKEVNIGSLAAAPDGRKVAGAIKRLAADIKAGRAAGGLFFVQNAALTLVLANRCPSLRAVPGTNVISLDESLRAIAPNVLVIEPARQTMVQMKNMILKFARNQGKVSDDLQKDLNEMIGCA